MKKNNIRKFFALIISALLILCCILLPKAGITSFAKGNTIQIDKTNVKESTIDAANTQTFGSYTFSLPDTWEDCDIDDEGDSIYMFIEGNDDLPMLMITKESLADYTSTDDLNSMSEDEEYETLEYFREGVLEDEDTENLTKSKKTTIAGNPAIYFSFTAEIYGTNDVRISVFIDKEEVSIYCLMLMEEEDADPSYFDDIELIEASFAKEGEVADVSDDLATYVYEALEDVYSYSAESVFDMDMEATEDGMTADLRLVMDHAVEATIGDSNSCYMSMTEIMTSEALGLTEDDYTITNEFCIIGNDNKTTAYFKEDGQDWETEDLDDEDSDLEEVNKYLGHIYSFELFEMLADGSIDYEVDSELLEVAADKFYVMEMDLSGEDFQLAVETQFFMSGIFFSDEIDYDDITSHVTIYINAETLLPSTVEIDMSLVGDQLIYQVMGISDATINNCTLITDYTGFNEFDEIEAPEL